MKPRSFALISLVGLFACKHDPPPPPPHVPVTTYDCRVGVHAIPPAALDVTASGTAATQELAVALAWEHVCAALPEANRGDCHNGERFAPNIMTASMTANGTPSATTTIHLEPRPGADSYGSAHSMVSTDDACHQATILGCQAAGASSGDCIAAGTHAESSRSSSTTRM